MKELQPQFFVTYISLPPFLFTSLSLSSSLSLSLCLSLPSLSLALYLPVFCAISKM